MRKETRLAFNQLHRAIAKQNDIESAMTMFNVEPAIEQQLEEKIQESSGFLNLINVVPVIDQEGEKVGVGSGGTIAGRTDTSGGATRQTQSIADLTSNFYKCRQTEFDSHITYKKLDQWAHKPNFAPLVSGLVNKKIAADRIMIGWNGTSAAATTDRVANPMLQDVNIGWVEKQRLAKPETVLNGIKIGDQAGGDYKNLDAAVYDMSKTLLAPWHQESTDLVVITGSKVLSDKYLGLINESASATERVALNALISNQTIGGLPVVRVPYFPSDALVVTELTNLSIYFQVGSTRRHLKDVPERNRIEDYRSVNEDYVVEDHDCFAALTGIQVPGESGAWV